MGVNPTGGGATLRESLPIGRRYSRFVRVVFQERTGHGQAARFRKARVGGAGRLRLDHHGGRGTDRAGARRRGIATVLPKHEQAGLAGRARAGTADAPSERTGGRTGRSSCGGLPDPGQVCGPSAPGPTDTFGTTSRPARWSTALTRGGKPTARPRTCPADHVTTACLSRSCGHGAG